ncbi:MAG: GNAT family N-acetyltransferase [Ruminococcus sp.]|nr:GNAT family N-acetyltransferase [Ruminococcus sp.]
MELRKLDIKEHGKTRKLWEQIFTEDSREFLDYYYFLKTRDNEIYVIEEDNEIRSMLQLNPYMLHIGEATVPADYIIAVATDERYRKQGYMRRLLCRAMQDMYNKKQIITFLMPAAEAIYTPYDFRFVYKQKIAEISGDSSEMKVELVQAGIQDAAMLAEFYEENFAERYQICTYRDESYYQTILFEQQSEHGGIMMMKSSGKLVGTFCYANEDGFMIREPLYLDGYKEEFEKAVFALKKEQKTVTVYAAQDDGDTVEDKPMIMVRILHLEMLLPVLKVREGETVDCSFAVLDPILTQNSRIFRIRGGQERTRQIEVTETEDSEGVLTIGAFTSLLSGYKSIEEIQKEEDVFLTDRLAEELRKIEPFDQVFINEVV